MPTLTQERANALTQQVYDCFPEGVENCCDIASQVIYAILANEGYKPALIQGEFFMDSHFWVECDGLLLDATIEQFSDRPMVCVAEDNYGEDLYDEATPVPALSTQQILDYLTRWKNTGLATLMADL
jgi:hypothetical protein